VRRLLRREEIIGASWNGGTSAAHTVQLVRAELIL
jgi:hypothetical protein